MRSAENIEIMKVGWKENYEKLQLIMQSDAYKAQYAENLELMLQQIQWDGTQELAPEQKQLTEENTTTTWTDTTTSWAFDLNEAQGE